MKTALMILVLALTLSSAAIAQPPTGLCTIYGEGGMPNGEVLEQLCDVTKGECRDAAGDHEYLFEVGGECPEPPLGCCKMPDGTTESEATEAWCDEAQGAWVEGGCPVPTLPWNVLVALAGGLLAGGLWWGRR